ncbi:succinate dehydrogenase, hydrophobic membrane anchor protein [Altererythrobacter sp. Root672]|uniref:succinate dehydrogenase, hydrophobic membrane anchor protein n=1 Tax=Altererythrobacter sp. Root672 TaxID=1736584 RepID=UPI0009E82280
MGNGTPIGRVRGHGSAHHGAAHWLQQRYTAAGNLIVVGYLVFSILLLPDMSYATLREWMSGLVPPVMIALLIVSVFWHARLGLQVLVEDYLHHRGARFGALLTLNLAAFSGAAFGLFCLARIVMSIETEGALQAAMAAAAAASAAAQGGGM